MCLHFWRENRGGLTDEAAQEEAVIEIVLNLFFFQLSVSNFPSFDRRISQMHSMSVIAAAKGWGEGGGDSVVACEERQLCDFLSESQGFDNLAIETN